MQRNTSTPLPGLHSKPRLKKELASYYQAFWDLIRSAQNTMGAQQPIPVSEVTAYARIAGFHDNETLFLYRLIKRLEGVWFEHRRKNPEPGEKGAGPKRLPPAPVPRRRPRPR